MNPIIIGAALAVSARLIAKHVTLPVGMDHAVEGALDAAEDISDILGHLDLDRPATWVQFGQRLVKRAITKEHVSSSANRWFASKGYTHIEERLPALWWLVLSRADLTIAYQNSSVCIWEVAFGSAHLFLETQLGESPLQVARYGGPSVRMPSDPEEREQILAQVAVMFWEGRTSVAVDTVDHSTLKFAPTRPSSTPYIGAELELLEVWTRYVEAGFRRSVLLQGAPGCGKSTFAREAARTLSKRTLFLTSDAVCGLDESDWQFMLEALQPEMLVVDDIDRIRGLEDKLSRFEEAHCDVPYVLFTSNDLMQLPLPMRRPGRIDQILRFDDPHHDVKIQIIRDFARETGVELQAERLPALVQMMTDLSAAHVLEALRRAAVEGWDAVCSTDITFGDGFSVLDEEPFPNLTQKTLLEFVEVDEAENIPF